MPAASPRQGKLFLIGGSVLLCAWLTALVGWANSSAMPFEKYALPGYPFGFFATPGGALSVQDFGYNLAFLRGIEQRVVARPYRLTDQEALIRHNYPGMTSGLSHAYSPVALALAQPLLALAPARAYLLYTALSALGIVALYFFLLGPQAAHFCQVLALIVCVASPCLALTFFQGQSALLTTTALGFFWFCAKRQKAFPALTTELALGILWWVLCLKPSVALIPFSLLLALKAWRALPLGGAFLLATWLILAPFYGGARIGLEDYAYLLNHYNNADFTPFMRRDYLPGHDAECRLLFFFDRWATLGLALALPVLYWRRTITLPAVFLALVASFLLFSPYLLPSEDWILCLVVIEGGFFSGSTGAVAKLLLLAAVLDIRSIEVLRIDLRFALKAALLGWMLIEQCKRPTIKDAVEFEFVPER